MPPKLYSKRISPIHGYGVFAEKDIKFGTLIIDWTDFNVVTEDEYLNGDYALTGVRYLNHLFLVGEVDDSDFFNHSDTPNVVYVFGIGYAWRDILKDEELFLDYRFLCSDKEVDVVRGYSGTEAFRKTIENLKTCTFLKGPPYRF